MPLSLAGPSWFAPCRRSWPTVAIVRPAHTVEGEGEWGALSSDGHFMGPTVAFARLAGTVEGADARLLGCWIPPAVVGRASADLVRRSTTRVRPAPTCTALTTFVLGWSAAWFLINLSRMPPYVPGATQDPTYAPPEAVAGLAVVAGALVLPVSAIACVLAFRRRARWLG